MDNFWTELSPLSSAMVACRTLRSCEKPAPSTSFSMFSVLLCGHCGGFEFSSSKFWRGFVCDDGEFNGPKLTLQYPCTVVDFRFSSVVPSPVASILCQPEGFISVCVNLGFVSIFFCVRSTALIAI
jgi:hypothetical protein